MERNLGGTQRIGSGDKMKVQMHDYGKSNNNLSSRWKSTMAAGTLVPFMNLIGLPGDSFDIDLDAVVNTHPTIGPLYDGFKLQLDVYTAPMRLYQSVLNNDKLGIGLKMADVKFPTLNFVAPDFTDAEYKAMQDLENSQINPSCILSYLGLRGIGISRQGNRQRDFFGVPLLAYWDIYRNYYANKAEGIGAVIHTPVSGIPENILEIYINTNELTQGVLFNEVLVEGSTSVVNFSGGSFDPMNVIITMASGSVYALGELFLTVSLTGNQYNGVYDYATYGEQTAVLWEYKKAGGTVITEPEITTFQLSNIDDMRELILQHNNANPFDILGNGDAPYNLLLEANGKFQAIQQTQEGLGLKTYQSDLLNNWMSTDWIDGINGINEITAVDVSGGSMQIDSLILARKVYDMLNRIAVSGGSYFDWIDTVYTSGREIRTTTPVYHGGLIKEIVFQEVISQAPVAGNPLGTLGGRGVMGNKHKGGKIHIKCDEPCIVMGIVSITPRINYSQGNEWSVHLKTMDDLHKPALDGIGFQDLITEQMAWFDSYQLPNNTWVQRSAGKQPSWMNYRTDIDRCFGNFAIKNNEMFMSNNRQYEVSFDGVYEYSIKDLTTYIDPSKWNSVFAQTGLDAQNFWVVISKDIYARRVMSSRLIPNL